MPPPADRQRGMGVRFSLVHRCLAWLIRHPELARELDLEQLQTLPDQDGKSLLNRVVELLQQAPEADIYHAFDYLCQHGLRSTLAPIAASDYLWLEDKAPGDEESTDQARAELEKLLAALTKRAPHAEYEALKRRINDLDPSLTKAEKQRFLELQKQRKL